jgi:hypothetical protein
MANVRAFRSGNWSDTNPATSPWGTGGVLYAPAANDDVYSNTFIIHVDQNVTVNSVTNASATSRLWKDGATTTATAGGTFNLLNGVVMTATILSITTNTETVGLSGTNSGTIAGTINGASGTAGHSTTRNTGTGTLTVVGTLIGSNSSQSNCSCITNAAGGIVNFTGSITAGTGSSNAGILNTSAGTIIVTGNVTAGTGSAAYSIHNSSAGTAIVIGNVTAGTGNTAYGINNSSTGTAIIVGNVIATSATNAFVSSNASAINKISGNIINHSNGTAAIYATRYVVDPIPKNSFIQYSNVNQFSIDSLSAFSMPPVSAVRFGTSFADGTLIGTCKVPSQNSVSVGVPVDNTVGTAFLTPAALFDTSVASLTSSNTLGARLKNSATVQSVGNIIASFSN